MSTPPPVLARETRSPGVRSMVAKAHVDAPGNGFRWYWLAWFVLALAAFLVPELTVLAEGKPQLTLSDTVRAVGRRYPWFKWAVTVALMIVAAGAVLLRGHFFGQFP